MERSDLGAHSLYLLSASLIKQRPLLSTNLALCPMGRSEILGRICCRDAEDREEEKPAAEEDAVTVIDEAPNAVAFFCKLLTSVARGAVLSTESSDDNNLTRSTRQTANSTQPYNTSRTTDTLLTIINTKDLIVLFCEYDYNSTILQVNSKTLQGQRVSWHTDTVVTVLVVWDCVSLTLIRGFPSC